MVIFQTEVIASQLLMVICLYNLRSISNDWYSCSLVLILPLNSLAVTNVLFIKLWKFIFKIWNSNFKYGFQIMKNYESSKFMKLFISKSHLSLEKFLKFSNLYELFIKWNIDCWNTNFLFIVNFREFSFYEKLQFLMIWCSVLKNLSQLYQLWFSSILNRVLCFVSKISWVLL